MVSGMSVIWWEYALDRKVVFVVDAQAAIEAIERRGEANRRLLDWLRSDVPVLAFLDYLYVRCRKGVE